jgi:hypothetical protein
MKAGAPQLEDTSLVTLEGTVKILERALDAPLSGKRCVAYLARGSYVRGGVGGSVGVLPLPVSSVPVVREETVPFVLVTDAGEVVVEMGRADLAIRPGAVVPHSPERELDFLIAAGVATSSAELSFDEVVVEVGARIRVHGIGRIDAEPGAAGFRDVPRVVTR